MLKFLGANLDLSSSPLVTAMERTHRSQHSEGMPGLEIGLGWNVQNRFGTEIIWKNGFPNGFRSFIGLNKKRRTGVIVLWNSTSDLEDIGRHLLESRYLLAKEHQTIKLNAKDFDVIAGEYELELSSRLKVSRKGDRFFIQMGDQGPLEVFAETGNELFLKVADVQLTFVKDEHGRVTQAILHQNGVDCPARRQNRARAL